MPIQRSLIVSNEARPGWDNPRIGAAPWQFLSRRFPLHFGLLLLAVLLSGCSAQPFRPRLPELPFLKPRSESNDPARPLRLVVPEEGGTTQALRSQIDSWAEGKQLTVELSTSSAYDQDLVDLLSGEDPPDLVVVSAFLFPDLAHQGLLAPADQGLLDPAGFPPQLAAAFTWPGDATGLRRYCLPREVRTLALVYDGAGLAALGLPPPNGWESLREVAVGLTDEESNRFGFIEAPDLSRWLPFLYAAGGTIIDENGAITIDSPPAAAAMDWYIQIFRDNFAGHAGESNNEWAGEVLAKGKGGITIEGNWIAPFFESRFPAYQYGVAPIPSGPAGLNTSVAFTSCYAVSAASARKDHAFELAAFLSSPDVVGSLPIDGGWMPAHNQLRDVWKRRFPSLVPFADAVATARVWQLPPGFSIFLDSFNRGMVHLFAATVEAPDFFAELQELGETLLETAGEPEPAPDTSQTSSH